MNIYDLTTPALLIERAALERNLRAMSDALPGDRLRPHVKAHKTTELARLQYDAGHRGFTCATVRETIGMAHAGLGEDLLLANESLRLERLTEVIDAGARVTVTIDSDETLEAAVRAGVREVVVDVNVGLPRCGIAVEDAGALADRARERGLSVRGVMGYEGHIMLERDESARRAAVQRSGELLLRAHGDVGGELITGGGTGTYALNTYATEIQAGSYALMDSAYTKLGLPFEQAVYVLGTVTSVATKWAVADTGLKSMSLDHGNPVLPGHTVTFLSDEHLTFRPGSAVRVGDRVRVIPSHVDPTIAQHSQVHVVDGDDVIEAWQVDLRGW